MALNFVGGCGVGRVKVMWLPRPIGLPFATCQDDNMAQDLLKNDFSKPAQPELSDGEVNLGVFHFGGTCVGLAHNYAGQRLDGSSIILRGCSWVIEENAKGPDGRHAVAFLWLPQALPAFAVNGR